jgi:uncharacterized protein YeaO (DUF488 family)
VEVRTKRIYEEASEDDGFRVLVDRIWPRGISHERAQLDAWEADLAPSRELRIWFQHQPERFEKFRRSYIEELRQQRPRLAKLRSKARLGAVTLLYAARDPQFNDATVLAEVLRQGLPRRDGGPPRQGGSPPGTSG